MREYYLDNAATTRPYQEVIEGMARIQTEVYGNPSSLHHLGFVAEKEMKQAKEVIAETMKVDAKEVFITSGGTESDNAAILGSAMGHHRRGRHLITTAIEHPAVLEPMRYLETQGFEVTYLEVDRSGIVSIDSLTKAIRPDTILVSIMHVNNEIGAIQPIEALADAAKEANPKVLFHTDAVQSYGKYRIHPQKCGIDLLSASAHKFHGPRGAGILYKKSGVRIEPLLRGGGQQLDLRPGTENLPGMCGMAIAAKLAYQRSDEVLERLTGLRRHMVDRLCEGLKEGVFVHGDLSQTAPYILNVAFPPVRSEVLLHTLEESGIYVSSGSACASNHPGISETLTAIGAPRETLDSSIRFSFSEWTDLAQIDDVCDRIIEVVPMLRRFTRR